MVEAPKAKAKAKAYDPYEVPVVPKKEAAPEDPYLHKPTEDSQARKYEEYLKRKRDEAEELKKQMDAAEEW